MKTVKCDMCGKTEPTVDCRYSRRSKFGWFRRYYSDESSARELDICETCYNLMQKIIKNGYTEANGLVRAKEIIK
jgi:hypothetical protein